MYDSYGGYTISIKSLQTNFSFGFTKIEIDKQALLAEVTIDTFVIGFFLGYAEIPFQQHVRLVEWERARVRDTMI